MKNKILIAAVSALCLLTGCGKATLKLSDGSSLTIDTSLVNPLGSTTALGEVTSCPAGTTLIPATIGISAYCMDNAANGSLVQHNTAASACATKGMSLCSIPQLTNACLAGTLPAGVSFWASNITSSSVGSTTGFKIAATGCATGPWNLSGSPTAQAFCCSN